PRPPPAPSPLSLHDALPICDRRVQRQRAAAVRHVSRPRGSGPRPRARTVEAGLLLRLVVAGIAAATLLASPAFAFDNTEPLANKDRKSTRLNSSHLVISYAV